MNTLQLLLISVLLYSPQGWPHGEDSAGPNGGLIQMPGAFHTEVVPSNPQKVQVYLLDMNFKNPTITNSTLSVSYLGKTPETAQCTPVENHFICEFSKKIDLRIKGKISLSATRDHLQGRPAIYELPLKPIPNHNGAQDHTRHH